MRDNFLEKWILNLIKSEYESENIPKWATYRLRERKDDFVEVTIEWINEDDNHKVVYHARSFGKKVISESAEPLEESIFELENYYTLEIHAYVNHIKRNYSTRRVANYDVMSLVGQLNHLNEIKEVGS